ncbi:MAG TPA: ATP-binding protein [Blastocatellia bacterium]|nr:ATP-binding protein [Blastocatellia bacterium]
MNKKLRSVTLRYVLPVVAFAALLLFFLGLKRWFALAIDPTILIIALLIASAWYGGKGSGLLVGIAFEVAIDYFSLATQPFTWRYAVTMVNRMVLFAALAFFTGSRRSAERRLRDQREYLRVSLASIGDAVIATDMNGAVTFINPTAEALTGWTAAEATGQPLHEVLRIVSEEARGPVESPFAAIQREGKVVGLANHTLLIARDGREIPIEDSGAPIKDPTGQMIGVIIVFHDVSERRLAEKEREQLLRREQTARGEAEAANRLKDEFLATVSHELRTPLNAILGWASLLSRRSLDDQTTRNAASVIERNAQGQARIIEDILDVSRIITGKLRIEPEAVELAPIIDAAIDTNSPAATAKAITIVTALDRDADIVLGDADRLQQIVWNLISNAIKFTPENGRIEVELKRVDAQVEIRVSDSGIGIDPRFLPYVFDRFRQADSSTTREHGGLGLGLAIVRHLTELHGGTVTADSLGRGRGAVFTVRLPLADVRVAPALAPQAASTSGDRTAAASALLAGAADLGGLRVLVVDDDPDTREILRLVLSESGAEVHAAGTSSEALGAFRDWKPHVLISDLGMPGEDGFALIKKVRTLAPEEGGNIPAAALTAYAREEDSLRARSAGYQIHISKPVDPTRLVAVVAGLARHAGKA